MTLMPEFQLARPRDVSEAIAASHEHAGSRFIAGGTDLLVQLRHGIDRPDVLIDLSAIEELGKITSGPGGVRIGAGVSIAALARDTTMAARYRAVKEAAEMIAAPGHRAMGTVGGNLCLDTRCIFYNQSEWWRRANGYCLKHRGDVCHVAPQGQHCHAAFAGDLAPALLALGAEVEIAGTKGRRRMPLGDLYVEDGRDHLTLSEDELLVAAHLPPDPPSSTYSKVRVRGAIDYPLAGVAVALGMNEGVVKSLRHRPHGHQFAAFRALRHRCHCRPADRRGGAAGDRALGSEAGAAHAHDQCVGSLSPAGRGGAGTPLDGGIIRRVAVGCGGAGRSVSRHASLAGRLDKRRSDDSN